MREIYFPLTTLHLLVSCGLALKKAQVENKILILNEEFPNIKKYIDSLLKWKDNPFRKIYILRRSYPKKYVSFTNLPFLKSIFLFIYNRKKIIYISKLWSKLKKDTNFKIYIFNDRAIEVQYLLTKNSCNIYVDDGMSSYFYTPQYISNHLKFTLKKNFSKFLFGFWYDKQNINGINKKINEIYSFYPQLLVSEIKATHKNIKKIPENIFESLYKSGLLNCLLNNFSIRFNNGLMNCIILLPHFEYFQLNKLKWQKARNSLIKLINIMEKNFEKLYLKYHPRDNRYGYLGLKSHKVELIENTIPIELIFLQLNTIFNSEILLIGPTSTAFLTARIILKKKIKIISYDTILSNKKISASILRVYKMVKVSFLNDLSELGSIIK